MSASSQMLLAPIPVTLYNRPSSDPTGLGDLSGLLSGGMMTKTRSASASRAEARPSIEPNANWREVARLMLTSRAIYHIEETELTPAGKVTYQFSARGHDLAQILLGLALDHPHDGAAVYYRSRPLALACGLTPEEAFAGSLARAGG